MTHIVLQLLRCNRILSLTEYPEYLVPCIAVHTVYEKICVATVAHTHGSILERDLAVCLYAFEQCV